MAVSQIAKHFQFDKNQASRGIKALLGKDSPFDKSDTSKGVKALPGEAFQFLKVEGKTAERSVQRFG